METYRFFVPDLAGATGTVTLPDEEARHARQVLRLAAGDAVELFDGKGAWAKGFLEGVGQGRNGQLLVRIQEIEHETPPEIQLTLVTAVPKGERAEWLVEQASQLNVAALQWLATDRGVVKPREGGGKMEKWRRLAIESAKQCGRNFLLDLREPLPLEVALQQANDAAILWLDPRPGGGGVAETLHRLIRSGRFIALIGPEGGWSPRECKLLEDSVAARRAQRVRLTSTVLRIETACAAIAAVVMSR